MRRDFRIARRSCRPARAKRLLLLWLERTTGVRFHRAAAHLRRRYLLWWRIPRDDRTLIRGTFSPRRDGRSLDLHTSISRRRPFDRSRRRRNVLRDEWRATTHHHRARDRRRTLDGNTAGEQARRGIHRRMRLHMRRGDFIVA
jgi:hypothetical protein